VGIRAARQRQPTPESPQRIVTACTTHDAYGAEMQELRRLMQALCSVGSVAASAATAMAMVMAASASLASS